MKYIITLCFLLMLSIKGNAQIFDTYDENIIKHQVYILLDKYEHLADFTEDGIDFSEDYKNSFENIFVDHINSEIYNDLQMNGSYISPTEYLQLVESKFPHGIETHIDSTSLRFLQAKLVEEDTYSIEAIVDKYVVGITSEKKIHRKKIVAHFIIQFKYTDDEFDDFLIESITNEETLLKRKSDKQMQGFHIGANLMPGISRLYMAEKTEDYNNSIGFPLSYSLGLSIQYFLNSNLGISLGANYATYNTQNNSEYNNQNSNNLERTDRDGDNYFLYVDSKIDEQGKFVFIDIPLNFTYRYGLADKISFFASLGFTTSLVQSAEFYVTGDASQSGFYPEYQLLIDDAELYDFGPIQYDNSYTVDISNIQFMASIAAGVSIPVGPSGYFNAGLQYQQNVVNLDYNTSAYRDDFISVNGIPQNSWLQFLAISISYTHKLFDFPKK